MEVVVIETGVTAPITAILYALLAVCIVELESLTLIVTLYDPVFDGVPERAPLLVPSTTPLGRLPAETLHE
jgi:hypothetical protein